MDEALMQCLENSRHSVEGSEDEKGLSESCVCCHGYTEAEELPLPAGCQGRPYPGVWSGLHHSKECFGGAETRRAENAWRVGGTALRSIARGEAVESSHLRGFCDS